MENVLLIISFVLFMAFVVGMFKPSTVIRFGKPSRGKVFLFFFVPTFVCFLFVGMLGNQKTADALENPDGVEELRLTSRNYEEVPDLLKDFKDLKVLSLRNNNITTLNKTILKMPLLEELDLSSNPLVEVPEWMTNLKHLKKINLNKTAIDTIPSFLEKSVEVSYSDTPYEKKELARKKGKEEGMESEGLGEFAIRKLLGNEYGYKKKFKKGELYYIKPVTEAQVDSLGAYLTSTGFFNEDRKVSMQITYNSTAEKPVYELRAITTENLEEEIIESFKLQAMFISMKVFKGEPLHFHLCDDQFNTHTILSSQDSPI